MSGFNPDKTVFAIACILVVSQALISGSIYPFSAVIFMMAVLICFFISIVSGLAPAVVYVWPAWVWLGMVYLSSLWTASLNATMTQAFFFTGFVLFSSLIAFSAVRKRQSSLLKVVMGVSAAVSLYAIYQYFFGFARTEDYLKAYGALELGLGAGRLSTAIKVLGYRRAFSTMLSPNVLACYLAAAFPAGLHLARVAPPRASKAVYVAVLALMSVAVVLTKSVGGLIALLVGACVFSLAMSGGGRLRKAAGVLLIIAAISAAGGYFVLSERTGGFMGIERSFTERLNYFYGALAAFSEAPLTGHGAGSFYLTYFPHIRPGADETRYAHNVVLQTLSETGIAGLVALSILFGVFLYRCVRGIRQGMADTPYPAILAGGAAFFVHNMLDFTFYVHETALLFWLYFGMAAAQLVKGEGTAPKWISAALKSATAVLVISFCVFYFRAEIAAKDQSEAVRVLEAYGTDSAAKVRSKPAPEEAVRLAEEAVTLKPYDDSYTAFLAALYEGTAYEKGPEYALKAEEQYKKAIRLNPLYPFHYRDLGILYLKLGKAAAARQSFEKALSLYPSSKALARLLSDAEK